MALSTPQRDTRSLDYVVLGEVLLLSGTATLVLSKWLRGQLDFYIHPRYIALSVLGAIILMLMAIVRLQSILVMTPSRKPNWGMLLLATPLLLGTLVPAQPLGASTLAERGLTTPAAATTNWTPPQRSDTASWNLLEWSYATVTKGEELLDQPADVIGFVYADPSLGADRFYVSRYVVTCCAADGSGVGMPVLWAGGGALPNDSWVRVRGSIDTTTIDGVSQLAILATHVEPTAEPDFPYLFP
jgi:putative membrane protein